MNVAHVATWTVAALGVAGVIIRPGKVPEAVWAMLAAVVLVACGLLPITEALNAVGKGTDVYLFLIGMMLLSEIGKREGLFDWLAAGAVRHAHGSPHRLFGIIFAVGAVVTVFLSNDATAVVLTPAVYAAAKAAKAEPLPYLLICAFIANAASFVLPISNPANLVLYAEHLPALDVWFGQFAMPSLLAIVATFVTLYGTQRAALSRQEITANIEIPTLQTSGRFAAGGIALTAILLILASAYEVPLGIATFVAGAITVVGVQVQKSESPVALFGDVSWSVLPLVAGLFVLVEGLQYTGVVALLARSLQHYAAADPVGTTWVSSGLVAVACNLMNNLPVGVLVGNTVAVAHTTSTTTAALLIGVDLGPNLSVTGSLATILWLLALRREGINISAWRFLRLGVAVMPPALILALAVLG